MMYLRLNLRPILQMRIGFFIIDLFLSNVKSLNSVIDGIVSFNILIGERGSITVTSADILTNETK